MLRSSVVFFLMYSCTYGCTIRSKSGYVYLRSLMYVFWVTHVFLRHSVHPGSGFYFGDQWCILGEFGYYIFFFNSWIAMWLLWWMEVGVFEIVVYQVTPHLIWGTIILDILSFSFLLWLNSCWVDSLYVVIVMDGIWKYLKLLFIRWLLIWYEVLVPMGHITVEISAWRLMEPCFL